MLHSQETEDLKVDLNYDIISSHLVHFPCFINYLIFLWLNSYSQKKPLPHFTSLPLNVLYP